MSEFTFTESGESYTIKGPQGMTADQARAILKQQLSTGSLVGFKVGEVLSAATQAADGLPSAQASLTQSLGSLAGQLPSNANLNTITASLGPAATAAATQAQSALQGSIPGISSTTTGSSAAVNAAISNFSTQLPVATEALTGQAAQAGSLANTALRTLTKSIKGVPLDGINVANFAKQGPALGSIGNLSLPDVTGTLAQASKLVGQSFGRISNSLGVGKFGLDASQLERAGMVKPGTAAAFLAQGQNELVDVLKSPTVWTGKDGVKGLDGLLKSPDLQNKIQQGLMSSGLNDIKSLGIPVDKLNPTALAGLATNAAKSVPATMAWITNSPNVPQIPTIPGGDVKAAFDNMATNGAFAVKMSQDKIEPALKQETPVVPAANTVNSDTVNAAGNRVVGNDKVPSVVADGSDSTAKVTVIAVLRFVGDLAAQAESLFNTVAAFQNRSSITQDEWNTLNQEYQVIRATFNSRGKDLLNAAIEAVNALPNSPAKAKYISGIDTAKGNATVFIEGMKKLKQFITDLANKIAT